MKRPLLLAGSFALLTGCASTGSLVSAHGHEVLTTSASPVASPRERCEPWDCRYEEQSEPIRSVILGARWADLMGFVPWKPRELACLNAVAQENDDVQYDHALRRSTAAGPAGGLAALRGVRARVRQRFLIAARAADESIYVSDGGHRRRQLRAALPYFLFGRALHIVQDSFSTYHVTRSEDFRTLLQVRSYVCTSGAPVHPHAPLKDLLLRIEDPTNGDLITKPRCSGPMETCIKPEYRAAVTASKELWESFERVRALAPGEARRAVAEREVDAFLAQWFVLPSTVPESIDELPKQCPDMAKMRVEQNECLKDVSGVGEHGEAPFAW